MELISCSTNIGYSGKKGRELLSSRIRAAITGSKIEPSPTAVEPDVNVSSPKEREIVTWNRQMFTVLIEGQANLSKCINRFLTIFMRTNKIFPIATIRHISITTYSIIPTTEYDFASLERKYREIMYKRQDSLWAGIYDSSYLFNARLDNLDLHHQSGAMNPDQLTTMFLRFPYSGDLRESFIFLSASVSMDDMLQYREEIIPEKLITISKYIETHRNDCLNIWKEIL